MADRTAKVYIVTVADDKGIRQYERGLDQATRKTDGLTKGTKGLGGSMRSLKDSIRATALQFPILGRLAEAALNPIGFLVASLIGSFALFNNRVKELARSLGGVEMPDVAKANPNRIRAAAEAYGDFAAAVATAAAGLRSVEAAANDAQSAIERQFELMKKLGGDSPALEKEKQRALAAGKFTEAANLTIRGRQRLAAAQGITVAGADVDAANLANLKERADAAQKEIVELQKRRQDVFAMRDAGIWGRIKRAPAHIWKYGAQRGDTILAAAETGIASHEQTVQQYEDFARRQRSREALRKEREALYAGAASDLAAGAAMRGEAGAGWMAAQGDFAAGQMAAGQLPMVSRFGGGATTSAAALNEIRRAYRHLEEFIAAFEEQNRLLAQRARRVEATRAE